MENNTLLEVKDLEMIYTTGGEVIQAVNHVSFTVDKGKVLGLVGETGAGKTSIARSILRILPQPPAKVLNGEIFLDGEDLMKKSEKDMRKVRGKKISMIFQDPMTALNPVFSVGDQITEVVLLHEKLDKKAAEQKAGDMLELVGIPRERYGDYPHQFSGGMKQRVVIAMALACSPELLLADEPTTALDVTIQAQVLDMMKNLIRQYQTSVIMITHDFGVVADICDNVAVVYAGEIVETGTREDIFDRMTHPYTTALFATIPSLTGDETRLEVIPGQVPNPAALPDGCHFHPRCKYADEGCRNAKPEFTEIEPGHYCRCCKAKELFEKRMAEVK